MAGTNFGVFVQGLFTKDIERLRCMNLFRLYKLCSGVTVLFIIMMLMVGLTARKLYAGTIRTTIDLKSRPESNGSVVLSGWASNSGTAIAYHPTILLFFGDRVEEYDGWEENPPGGKIRFQTRFDCAKWIPGTYSAIVLLAFEERGGKRHRVYHISSVSVGIAEKVAVAGKINVIPEPVNFNLKTFWQKESEIGLVMKNNHRDRVALSIRSFFGEGFYSMDSMVRTELGSGEERRVTIGLTREDGRPRREPYTIDIQYETGGRHYSVPVAGSINIVSRPIYLKVFGGICVLVLCGALLWQYRKALFKHQ